MSQTVAETLVKPTITPPPPSDSPVDSSIDFRLLPELQISQEEMTALEMRGALIKLGFEFHPKTRKINLPVGVNRNRLSILVGDDEPKQQNCRNFLSEFTDYLNGEIISDRRFNTDDDRGKFRDWMESEKFRKDAFITVYNRSNQLRGNRINAVTGNLHLLSLLIKKNNPQIAEKLIKIKDKLMLVIGGDGTSTNKGYKQMDLEEKVQVIQLIEDAIIEALNLIAGPEAEKQEVYIS